MGIPYSRQINAAFEQVTPLVAAGYAVLRTTRDISILLAVIQVLTVVLLALILVVLGMVLVCVDQDLEVRSFSHICFEVRGFFWERGEVELGEGGGRGGEGAEHFALLL